MKDYKKEEFIQSIFYFAMACLALIAGCVVDYLQTHLI